MKDAKLYAERETDSPELMAHYLRHVSAMTTEGLHAKSAIAAELAWRDAKYEAERAAREAAEATLRECVQYADSPFKRVLVCSNKHDDIFDRARAVAGMATHAEVVAEQNAAIEGAP